MPFLAFLGQAMMWISAGLVARWLVIKLFIIGCLVVVLPWVLKDGINWFWDATNSSRQTVMEHFTSILNQQLSGINSDVIIHLTSIGGYIANQIGLQDYATIIVTTWGICWGYKIGAKFL